MEIHSILSGDEHTIQAYSWKIKQPKACIHINHGMAEHALRYDKLANHLNQQGYDVIAHNHRGHGDCSNDADTLGVYAESNGWHYVLDDITRVRNALVDEHLPYVLFGHSMGSFIVQSHILRNSPNISGLILSGSNWQPKALLQAGNLVASIEQKRVGKSNPSSVLQWLSFGSFNTHFKPNRTEFDWLSRDPIEVDRYIADPLCGFDCSVGLWKDFFSGMIELYTKANFSKLALSVPVYLFGGDKDPVGAMGKGLPKLADAYQDNGVQDVSMKLYSGGRHEMINEINRDEVFDDIANWLNKHIITE